MLQAARWRKGETAKTASELGEGIRFENEPCTEIALFWDRYDFTISLLHLGASPAWHVDDDDGLEELQGFDWT